MMEDKNNIAIYQDADGALNVSVRFADDDVWLTQRQLAEIYVTSQQNISLHIDNIYKDMELPQERTHKEFFATVQNKLHYAVHEHTAAELIYERVDHEKPYVGMTNFKGDYDLFIDETKKLK